MSDVATRALRRLFAVSALTPSAAVLLAMAGAAWLLRSGDDLRAAVEALVPWLLGASLVAALAMRLRYARPARRWVHGASEADRELLLSAPRRAASAMLALSLVVLASGLFADGWVAPSRDRAVVLVVSAAVALVGALVLYPATRWALRPALSAAATRERSSPLASMDRLALRGALAVAVPAGVVALLAALVVSTHLGALWKRESAREARVMEALGAPGGAPARTSPSVGWAVLAATAAALFGGRVGGRVAGGAARSLGAVAKRVDAMGRSGAGAGATVPGAEPEVAALAVALDAVAARLASMSADQRRALTTRLEAARLRSFVLAGVSHDLRGPLNAVLGFSGLLLSGVDGPLTPGQRESVDAIERRGRDLLRLVDDLLDSAKLDAGRMSLHPARSTAGALVGEAKRLAGERVGEAVTAAVEGEVEAEVVVDPVRTGAALGALVAYGWRRAGAGAKSSVALRVRAVEAGVEVVVRGCGPAPTREAMDALFEPFEARPEGARAPAGAGLAAAVARRVVGLQGGVVRAEAGPEGAMVLRVTLPGRRGPATGLAGPLSGTATSQSDGTERHDGG